MDDQADLPDEDKPKPKPLKWIGSSKEDLRASLFSEEIKEGHRHAAARHRPNQKTPEISHRALRERTEG
jgi:hypothetical protein